MTALNFGLGGALRPSGLDAPRTKLRLRPPEVKVWCEGRPAPMVLMRRPNRNSARSSATRVAACLASDALPETDSIVLVLVDRLDQQFPVERRLGPVGPLDRQEIARHEPDVELPALVVLGLEHRRNHGDLVQHDSEAGNVVSAFHGIESSR